MRVHGVNTFDRSVSGASLRGTLYFKDGHYHSVLVKIRLTDISRSRLASHFELFCQDH